MLLLKFKCLLIKKIHMLVCIKTPAFSYMFSTSRQLWSSWSLFNIRQTDGRMNGRTFLWTDGRADGRAGGRSIRRTDVPTLHIVSYFAGTDAFMSLHKPIITLFLTLKYPFYEFTNSFHSKYKPISSKCWLGRTKWRLYAFPFGGHKNQRRFQNK